MKIIRLLNGQLVLHSPCQIGDAMKLALSVLGNVAYIVGPGSDHHQHLTSVQAAFPHAKTFIRLGVEPKCYDLDVDPLLADAAPEAWADWIEQVRVRGSRWNLRFR